MAEMSFLDWFWIGAALTVGYHVANVVMVLVGTFLKELI